jgi:hypothetical protein
MEDNDSSPGELYRRAGELKGKFPQISWIVAEEPILLHDHESEIRLCLKIPQHQYEAAKYLAYMLGNPVELERMANKSFDEMQASLDALAYISDKAVDDKDELLEIINEIEIILCDIYKFGSKLPMSINLHLKPQWEEGYDLFDEDWNYPDSLVKEFSTIQENLSFIYFENMKYFPMYDEPNPLLEPGFIHEAYNSFYSENGWGKRLLETLNQLRNVKEILNEMENYPATEELKGFTLLEAAIQWMKERITKDHILDIQRYKYYGETFLDPMEIPIYENIFPFTITNYDGLPDVFLQPSEEGINLGYVTTEWHDPHLPVPKLKIRKTIPWEKLVPLSNEEKEILLIEQLFNLIKFRQRQLKNCQFCGEKIPPGQLFNKKTCYSCATEFFRVIY